ncbi:hypothetical protein FGG08_000467 [Glutinoglossum americanum]|uniref:Uncharacterized protein n=1 Tax=Glutinoglossum americanum TaxID=1670608 RepID=A0A9P8IFD1_9PEZI|nr:hypothetical protein FGG08_000467 [Glutinoglossum americanum]
MVRCRIASHRWNSQRAGVQGGMATYLPGPQKKAAFPRPSSKEKFEASNLPRIFVLRTLEGLARGFGVTERARIDSLLYLKLILSLIPLITILGSPGKRKRAKTHLDLSPGIRGSSEG